MHETARIFHVARRNGDKTGGLRPHHAVPQALPSSPPGRRGCVRAFSAPTTRSCSHLCAINRLDHPWSAPMSSCLEQEQPRFGSWQQRDDGGGAALAILFCLASLMFATKDVQFPSSVPRSRTELGLAS